MDYKIVYGQNRKPKYLTTINIAISQYIHLDSFKPDDDNIICTHTVGVSLKLQGVTIPNNSLVDFHDILYRTATGDQNHDPTNDHPELHNQSLLCVTDLEDCCRRPRTVHGDWYYPDGSVVQYDIPGGQNAAYRRNRSPNEVRNGQKFYGSVRLFCRFTPSERGRFCCELPSAADPSVNQILYVYICEYGLSHT